MQFAQPLWLLAGVAVCATLVWQYRRFDLRQRVALTQFASARLLNKLTSSVSTSRRLVKRVLFTLGIGLLFVALARPQAGFEFQATHRKGLELLFAVDTSKSMLAQDVKPDRLTRAKLAVADLVGKLNGDGVGLVAFAGSAFLQCPVTLDYDAFLESLDALDVNVIPRGGTNIASAIHEAEAVFKTRSATDKILVLITDGEDLDGEALSAAQAAARDGLKIFTVGVGSTSGELVPIPSETGGTTFAKDENGNPVKSHLDEGMLKKIAEASGGMYQPLGGQSEGLSKIYEQGLSPFARHDLSAREAKVPLEKFHWVLLAALACFICELLIGNRRRVRAPKQAGAFRPVTAAAALVVLAGVASAEASPQTAEQAYQKGDFAKSAQEYAATAAKEPAKAELQFNTGSAAYKAGDYAKATSSFQRSLKTEQVRVQQDAYYNLGNTQYRLGEKTEKEKPQDTIKTWEEAVKSYDAALQIKHDDAGAKHNREVVSRKLEQLKKEEEQKKQDQQDQKDQQQKQDQKSDSKDQKKDSQSQGGESKNQEDQKGEGKDQPKDSKDQKGDSKDQKQDSKDKESGAGDQKNDPKDSKGGDNQKKPGDSKDQNGGDDKDKQDQPKDKNGEGQKEEPKDQKSNARPQDAGDKKEDQRNSRAEAGPGKGEQPKPVDPAKKPFKGEATAANGENSENTEGGTAAEERREPGELTKEEAKQLLDALKNDEHKAPAISQQARGAEQPDDKKISKDW
jgi:Ca-activated chloride channel homolog